MTAVDYRDVDKSLMLYRARVTIQLAETILCRAAVPERAGASNRGKRRDREPKVPQMA